MAQYRHNKLKTAWEIMQRIENWPTAFGMRIWQRRTGLRLLNFRDGLNVVCRGGNVDWVVLHELLFAGSYLRSLEYLKSKANKPVILDLGGNIGLFSLLAARAHPAAEIYAYEPGPPNYRLFEMNCLTNASLAKRIHLEKEAVGGHSRQAEWFFDDLNPGASGLFGNRGAKFTVQIRAFADLIRLLPAPVDLVKIDIEGAEYELLAETPPEVWKRVNAISLELHDDPSGAVPRQSYLEQLNNLGYTIEEEEVCSLFLHR